MRIRRVAVRCSTEVPDPDGYVVAELLSRQLTRDGGVSVSHVSRLRVSRRSVELAAFVDGGDETADGLREAVVRSLRRCGAPGERWWVLAPRSH